jgi:CHAD domain-containing protein
MKAASPSVALLRRRARAVLEPLPQALAGDPAALHRARVASRRLREALPVVGAGPHMTGARRRVQKLAKRLTRALGSVRELDVALQILDERANGGEQPAGTAIDRARGVVRLEREGRRAEMLHRLQRVSPEKLRRRLEALGQEIGGVPQDIWRRALAARLAQRARRLEQAIAKAGPIFLPDRLHAVRIAAKKLRYTLELAVEAGVADARPLVAAVKRAQTKLGRLQDLQVVLKQIDAASAEPGLEPAARAGLALLARSLDEDARRAHGRYLRIAPRLAAVCVETRRHIVPSLTAGRRPAARMKLAAARGPRGSRRSAPAAKAGEDGRTRA